MSIDFAGWQALGFAVQVNPDGLRDGELIAVMEARLSARAGGADGPAASAPGETAPANLPPITPPTLLGMAASATKSAVKFAASGFKTVAPETHRVRVAQCAECQHRNGNRCRVCGCFFDKKARLPHEDCPIGKWPA